MFFHVVFNVFLNVFLNVSFMFFFGDHNKCPKNENKAKKTFKTSN